LSLGYNFQPRNDLVIGVQLEGTLANATSTARATQVGVSLGSVSSFTNTTRFQSLWAASALARVGWTPEGVNLIYGVAGWTYSYYHSDFLGADYGMQGPSFGAGWERRFAGNWTLRGEYRYTRFHDTQVSYGNMVSTTTNPPFTFSSSNSSLAQINAEMHAIRIGASYLIGQH
jgi:opacity protein-like surface antigen